MPPIAPLLALLLACAAPPPADHLVETRAIVAEHAADPIDPCAADCWAFHALDVLNAAVARDRDGTLRQILKRDPGMEPLASSALFRRWMQMQRASIDTDNHIRFFLNSTLPWHLGARKLTFAERGGLWLEEGGRLTSGTWTVQDGTLHLDIGGRKLDGRLVYRTYWIELDLGAEGSWLPDPPLGDCG